MKENRRNITIDSGFRAPKWTQYRSSYRTLKHVAHMQRLWEYVTSHKRGWSLRRHDMLEAGLIFLLTNNDQSKSNNNATQIKLLYSAYICEGTYTQNSKMIYTILTLTPPPSSVNLDGNTCQRSWLSVLFPCWLGGRAGLAEAARFRLSTSTHERGTPPLPSQCRPSIETDVGFGLGGGLACFLLFHRFVLLIH